MTDAVPAHKLGRVLGFRSIFGIGAGAGLLLGFAMGTWPRLHAQLDPIVALLHPIPKIAVLPLILVVVTLIFAMAFFPGIVMFLPNLFYK